MFQMAFHESQVLLQQLQPYAKHGNTYTGSIFTFLLGSCGVALAIAPLLTEDQLKDDLIVTASYYFGFTYILLFIVICLVFVWKHKGWVNDGIVTQRQQRIIRSNSHLQQLLQPSHELRSQTQLEESQNLSFQIMLFGIGSILYQSVGFLQEAYKPEDTKIKLVDRSLLLLSCIVYIVFLRIYSDSILKYRQFFQFSVAFITGGVVCIWVILTVRPLWNLDSTATHNATRLEFDLDTVIDVSATFLQPFFIEFLSISLGCLACLWQSMRDSTLSNLDNSTYDQQSYENEREQRQDYGTSLDAENQSTTSVTQRSFWSHKLQKRVFIILSVVMGFAYIAVGIAFVFLNTGTNQSVASHMHIIARGSFILIYMPGVIFALVSLKKLQSSTDNIPKIKQFTTVDYILLLTTGVQFIYNILELIAAVISLYHIEGVVDIFYMFFHPLKLSRIWLQTQFILTAHYVHRSTHRLPKIAEFTLVYLIGLNLAEWLSVSFMLKWSEENLLASYVPVLLSAFGSVNTKIIILVFDPLKEMYLFHSAVVAYEAQKMKH